MENELIETWQIHNRINLYLLDAVAPNALTGTAASKGRTVAQLFAHIHNNRVSWLEAAAPELMQGLAKIKKEEAADKPLLRQSLEESGLAVEELLKRGLAGGRIKGFKPHTVAFIGYLIAHEAYHHGEIGVTLTQSGHPLDKKIAYGMWEWGVR